MEINFTKPEKPKVEFNRYDDEDEVRKKMSELARQLGRQWAMPILKAFGIQREEILYPEFQPILAVQPKEDAKAQLDVWLHAPEQLQETYKKVWETRNRGYIWEKVATAAVVAESTARKYYVEMKAWRENPPKR